MIEEHAIRTAHRIYSLRLAHNIAFVFSQMAFCWQSRDENE
jgi:hypothetical protein